MNTGFGFGLFIGTLGTVLLLTIWDCEVEKDWKNEAVKHHAATYYLDKQNQRQWRWNDEKEKE